MPTTYSDIQAAQQKVEELQKAYLRRWGWEHTCNVPGSLWMWPRNCADLDAARKARDDEHEAGKPGKAITKAAHTEL